MRHSPTRAGFTLIELLIVIVIIGILAMIAMSIFWSAKDRGLLASLQADLKSAALQQELYFNSHNAYAPSVGLLETYAGSPGVILDITYAAADGWAGVTTHPSIVGKQCGLLINAAPLDKAPPATDPGKIMCSN